MKRFKKLLSALLVAVLLIGTLTAIFLKIRSNRENVQENQDQLESSTDSNNLRDDIFTGTETTGTIINFGSYPQSKVTDSELILALETVRQNVSWISYNYYVGNRELYYENQHSINWNNVRTSPSDYMKYCDISYGGDKYRAVYFSSYRPAETSLVSSDLNSVQDEYGYFTNTVYYFKFEPLKWKVLDASKGLLMSEKIIDSQPFQNFFYFNGENFFNGNDCINSVADWETSSIRKWLNSDFYNTAFTEKQKSKILSTHNDNKDTSSSTYDKTETDDTIFLLSYWDAINQNYSISFSSKKMKETDYARCQGFGSNNGFWLRSHANGNLVHDVSNGIVSSAEEGGGDARYIQGIVPALRLDY